MIKRLKQFYRAITAKVTDTDKIWLAEKLSPVAQELFYAMHEADQYHALNVAKTALKLLQEYDITAADKESLKPILIRCALLHDVGRVRGDLDIWGKVFTVLMVHSFPQIARKLQLSSAKYIWQRPGHALFVYYQHPAIGAAKLRKIGLDDEAFIIAKHHDAENKLADSVVLKILRAADELN